MNTQYDDTLPMVKKPAVNEVKAEKKRTQDALVAKIMASSAVGLALGIGTAYASRHLHGTEEEAELQEGAKPMAKVAPAQEQQEPQPAEPAPEPQPAAPATRQTDIEAHERQREQQEQERRQREEERPRNEQHRQRREEERHEERQPEPKLREAKQEEEDFFQSHDVKIQTVEKLELEDGRTVQVYVGKVDGHDAAFMDDGRGKVIAAIVDRNDNGTADDDEVIDLRASHIPSRQLAMHQVEEETPEVRVVSVEHDVLVNGQTVDVAEVTVDEEHVVLVDTNQNGEVDVLIADNNHNGSIEADELHDVTDDHIAMPVAEDAPDYMTAEADAGTADEADEVDMTLFDA